MNSKFDIIIVGSGIAGCSVAWQWLHHGKSVYMISDVLKGSSSVAAGVYNPTILKRFTGVWKATEQLDILKDFYPKIESQLDVNLLHPIDVLRRFHDEKEIKTWIKKSVKEELIDFMSSGAVVYENDALDAPFDYGQVKGTGWLDTIAFMKFTTDHLSNNSSLLIENFDFTELEHYENYVKYKNIEASKIIFAEGFKMNANPYFKELPLQGNKGEVLTIKVPGLKLSHIIKSSVFLMPYTEDLFWVGATYSRDDISDASTDQAREFLTSRLERFLKLPYEIVDHKYGIRPTTLDRRPFVGAHSKYNNYIVFNGMGSRAVLMAPWAAQQLFNCIYNDKSLNEEIDIKRFDP